MTLSEWEIEERLVANKGLVYYMLHKYFMLDDEGAEDVAKDGLYKAIVKYDETRNPAFGPFAITVIRNELFMYLRKKKVRAERMYITSLDLELLNSDGDVLTVGDLYADESVNPYNPERIEFLATVQKVTKEELDKLDNKAKHIMRIWLECYGDIKQHELVALTDVSQTYVAKVVRRFKDKVKLRMEILN